MSLWDETFSETTFVSLEKMDNKEYRVKLKHYFPEKKIVETIANYLESVSGK